MHFLQPNIGCLCKGHAGVWSVLFPATDNAHQDLSVGFHSRSPAFTILWIYRVTRCLKRENSCAHYPENNISCYSRFCNQTLSSNYKLIIFWINYIMNYTKCFIQSQGMSHASNYIVFWIQFDWMKSYGNSYSVFRIVIHHCLAYWCLEREILCCMHSWLKTGCGKYVHRVVFRVVSCAGFDVTGLQTIAMK